VIFQPFSGVTHAESTTYGGKGKEKQKEALLDIVTDEHAPERVRVDAAMSQLSAFSRAFGCPADSPMNPKQRCDMW
jgi:predicted metalloendopeptidase